ncbi:MAG: transcription antitermination factor NusB [Gemmatimonadetes bacterium]|nr:transcription antitermination factor NusB [Gemmatimonadota bacterium]
MTASEARRGSRRGPGVQTESIGPRLRRDRSRARAWFLQVHYRWESEGGDFTLARALSETLGKRLVAPRRIPYLERLVDTFARGESVVDGALTRALDNWTLERLSVMDRGILRLGATEMLFLDDIPPKVAIQEAVRMGERYGGAESPRFVNGVLDAVLRQADD